MRERGVRSIKLKRFCKCTTSPTGCVVTWILPFLILLGSAATADDCVNCNFDHKNLAFADFSGSDLSGASFRKAYLVGANFTGAILDGADFTGAIANAAIFKRAELKNARFLDAELELTHFTDANFHNTDFTRAYMVHSKLDDRNQEKIILCTTTMFNATVSNKDC